MTQYVPKEFPGLVAVIFLLVLSVFFGGTVAIFGYLAVILWSSIFFIVLIVMFLLNSRKNHSGNIFIIGFLLFFILPFVKKTMDLPLIGYWQLLLLFFIFGIPQFVSYIRSAPLLIVGLVTLIAFFCFGSVSTLLGRSHFLPAGYQVFSDFKPTVLIILGFAITWCPKTEKFFWRIVEWFWLPVLLLIGFEWVLPGSYFGIFKGSTSPDPTGMFPSRAVGPFQTPSLLAASAAMFALLCFSRLQNSVNQKMHDLFRVIVYLIILICTVQRQELITLIVALILVFILANPNKVISRSLVAFMALAITLTAFWVVFSENIMHEAAQWGVGTYGALEHPRAQIYQGAFSLATQYFPFGSGFGTYGGAGADKFDQSLYFQLGFSQYWWFGKQNYLMDTYWPNSIAETGFFGAFLLFASYVFFFLHALLKSISVKSHARIYWLFSSAGMLYLLGLSITSPAFQDPLLSFLPLLAFGIAYSCELRYEKTNN